MRCSVLLLLLACGSDPDPHVVGTCVGWTDNGGNPYPGQCEAACREPPTITGATCDTKIKLGCPSLRFDDHEGCCLEDANMVIRFVECVP